MRVLFFLHETGAHNGAWKSAYNLLCGLRDKGIDLCIITPDRQELYKILKKEDFRVISVKVVWNNRLLDDTLSYKIERIPYDFRRKVLSIFWWIRVSRIIKSFHPDIIHTNSSVFYLSYDIAKYYKIPHVWHIREYGGKDFNLDLYPTERRINENISNYICIAKDLERDKGLYGNPKSQVVYNGILSTNRITHNSTKDNYFLFVGSLVSGKGIKDILDAWHLYKKRNKDSNYVLKIAGGKKTEIENWQKYIDTIGAQNDEIEFLGIRDDVYSLMSHCKSLIMGSYFEAFGRVTAEAMFCGSLVIGRDTAGTKEQFDNGVFVTGKEIGLRFHDVNSLTAQIEKVATMGCKEYDEFIDRAQKTVAQLYSNEAYVDGVLRVYHSIISK